MLPYALLGTCWGLGILGWWYIFFRLLRGNNHSRVRVNLIPCSNILFLHFIIHWFLKKDTVHPTSHNFTTDRSNCCRSCGIMCAAVAALGNSGQYMSHVCVESIVLPSGIIIFNGLLVGLIFLAFTFTAIKWPVVPEFGICSALFVLFGRDISGR